MAAAVAGLSRGAPRPGHETRIGLRIEYAAFARLKTVAGEYVLGRLIGDLREHRPSARQTNLVRTRQMEGVIAVEEQAEHLGAADDRNRALFDPERRAGGGERSARRVPQ